MSRFIAKGSRIFLKRPACSRRRLFTTTVAFKNGIKPEKIDDKVQDMDKMDVKTLQRLSKVYRLLNTSFKKLDRNTYECFKLYGKEGASLIEDLFASPVVNENLLTYIFLQYNKTSSIKVLVLHDLKQLILDKKFSVVSKCFQHMFRAEALSLPSKDHLYALESGMMIYEEDKLEQMFINFVIKETAISGEPLLASSFALELKELNVHIESQTLDCILRTLLIDNSVHQMYHHYTIMRLLKEFTAENIKPPQLANIFRYLLEENQVPFFANAFYSQYILPGILAGKGNNNCKDFVKLAFILMQKNLNVGNKSRAYDIWTSIKKKSFVHDEKCVGTLKEFIELLLEENEELANRVIKEDLVPDIYGHPNMIDFFLVYFGTRPQFASKFDQLVKKLSPPLQRLYMSLLFKVFLERDSEAASEKILESIFNSEGGLNSTDFKAIIAELTRQKKIEYSFDMLKRTDIEVAKEGYVHVLDHILVHSNTDLKRKFLDDIVTRFKMLRPDDECIKKLVVSIFGHISTRVNNRASRSMFAKLSNNSFEQKHYELEEASSEPLNLEQYGIPMCFPTFLHLQESTKIACLNIILEQAVKDGDVNTIEWAIGELRFQGVLLKDIVMCIKTKNNKLSSQAPASHH